MKSLLFGLLLFVKSEINLKCYRKFFIEKSYLNNIILGANVQIFNKKMNWSENLSFIFGLQFKINYCFFLSIAGKFQLKKDFNLEVLGIFQRGRLFFHCGFEIVNLLNDANKYFVIGASYKFYKNYCAEININCNLEDLQNLLLN